MVKKWHYLAVRSLPALFRGISSNHNGVFLLFKLLSFIQHTKKTLKKHEQLCNNHDYCHIEIPKDEKY